MPERKSYSPGTPSWIDLLARSRADAKAFYGDLFGWTFEDVTDPEGTVVYTQCFSDGHNVCGLGEMPAEMAEGGTPPFWTTYVATDDADATAAAVETAGGSVMAPTMQIFDAGRMAMFTDPTGASFAVWEPGTHPGAALVNEPVALAWNELDTRDPDRAVQFYGELFGWEAETHTEPMPYTEWHLDGEPIGGMMPMPAEVPPQVPSYWLTYFAVADTDATVARLQELGGTVMVPPTAIPTGRFSVLADPAGATFAVIQLAG
jgi:predicted enzyme related to lactoylglutathione lyase